MMRRLVYIINLLGILFAVSAYAQEDTLKVEEPQPLITEDSISIEVNPLALDLYIDYGKGVESLISDQKKWEFGLGFVLKDKFSFIGEYGYGKLFPQSVIQNGTYEVEGNYYRVGAEYIFTLAPFRQLSIGGMYASSTFSDYGTVQISSELWPDVNENFARENTSASWAEVILNTQGPIINAESGFFSQLYLGIRFRLRIMITDLERTDFDIYAVPGYGKTYSRVLPAANFFLKYRLNF